MLKQLHVNLSRIGRREIYDATYRQWHWRVAAEQLIYSHFDNVVHGDASTPIRYTLNTVPMLLAAGSEDNYIGAHIYDNTEKLGRLMTNTPGRVLLIGETGHSIHVERPAYFAREIAKFLSGKSMQVTCVTRKDGRIQQLGGSDVTDSNAPVPFHLTEDECMEALQRGDEFFVIGADGSRSNVYIANRPPLPYFGDPGGKNYGFHLKTFPDPTHADNLLSLPDCPD